MCSVLDQRDVAVRLSAERKSFHFSLDGAKSVFSSVFPEMTLLSSQPKPLDSTPTLDSSPLAGTGNEDPEVRMLEKRSKVIEELLQTEKDYIKDLQMCVEEIIEPLHKKQVKKPKES